jgi:cell division protein FtsA
MEKIVAAVDIGTSKIVAMAAKKTMGLWEILASETHLFDMEDTSKMFVRRGVIVNTEGTARIIADLLKRIKLKLEERSLKLERVYIGYGGQGLHTEPFVIRRTIGDEQIVQEDLDSIREELCEHPDYGKIRNLSAPEYFIDGVPELSPLNKACRLLEAHYLLFMGHKADDLRKQIENRSLGISVENVFVSPEASVISVLKDSEITDGCALVEIGAGVTTVSIHHKRRLRFMATVPLGGLAITKDLCSLHIPFAEAENQKINYGEAYSSIDNSINTKNPTEEEKLQFLNNVISWRVHEIARNVEEVILRSGYAEYVNSIILTGGSARLNGLSSVFETVTGKKTRVAMPNRTYVKQSVEETHFAGNTAIIGMFAMANKEVNCCSEIVKPAPVVETDDSSADDTEGTSKSGGLFGIGKKFISKVAAEFNSVTSQQPYQHSESVEISPAEKEAREKARLAKIEQETREQAERERRRHEEELENARRKAEQEEKRRKDKEEKERRKQEEEERKRKIREAKANEPGLFDNIIGKIDEFNNMLNNATTVNNNE